MTSNHEADAVADEALGINGGARLHRLRIVAVGTAVLLGLGASLAACGDDDDDASDLVTSQSADSAASSAPDTQPTTTRASTTSSSSSTSSSPSTSSAPSTTGRRSTTTTTEAADTEASASVESTTPTDGASAAGAETTAADAAEQTRPPVPETSIDGAGGARPSTSTVPTASEPARTVSDSSGPTTSAGPTTTAAVCEYTDNDELPLVRCDSGPPVFALQSVLQVLEYEIGTVDCLFGDQTHDAVRAFQADEELTVSGEVDEETWAALEESFLGNWGTDTNGNGTIEPNEVTLVCP